MLRRLTPGETITPQLWNSLVERLGNTPTAQPFAVTEAPSFINAASELRPRGIEFLNDSGMTVPAYGVLRVTGFSTANGHRALVIEQPDNSLARNFAVNGAADVPAGQYGMCYLGGVVEVLYSGTAPSAREGFGPQSGSWSLARNRPAAFTSLGVIDAAGQVMACQCEPLGPVIGKLAGSLAPGGSATVDIWAGAPGSESVLTGVSITAHDWLLPPGAGPVASGATVVCQWINSHWYVTGVL